MKPILCLDFDGVLHLYSSGWQGARNIPDPPVAGAIDFLFRASKHFQIAILSSRSRYFGGRRAMKRWLREWITEGLLRDSPKSGVEYVENYQAGTWEPWDVSVRDATRKFVRSIDFPKHKPPAKITLDDRALRFMGDWPSIAELQAFKPWNKELQP